MLSREHKAERTFDELFVRSETGLGSERALEKVDVDAKLETVGS